MGVVPFAEHNLMQIFEAVEIIGCRPGIVVRGVLKAQTVQTDVVHIVGQAKVIKLAQIGQVIDGATARFSGSQASRNDDRIGIGGFSSLISCFE